MERIKKALEKARQERQLAQGGMPLPDNQEAPARAGHDLSQTEDVVVDEAILKKNRIINGLEHGPFTEAYNMLRTQVLQRFRENNWNVLAVTSPGPGEGKTLTAINLAVSIAREVDYTVLLVDANLRHPWMLEHLGINHRKGLSEYLTEDVPLTDLLIKGNRIENSVILPGGRPLSNSAEMLNSPKMERLVEDLKSRYQRRIIIFDLPPVLTSADAVAFSPYVDAALLVVEEGVTQENEVERALDLLSGINVIGTVLNKAEPSVTQ